MVKLLIVFTCSLILFLSCNSIQHGFVKKNGDYILPPGNIQVEHNLFIDQNEISNFSWLEYLYYLEKVFGKKSETYLACMPDTAIWSRIDLDLVLFSKFYLRHAAYRNFPVVGISRKQAEEYTNWRSDRVLQFILIRDNVIKSHRSYSFDSVFTAEKYYTGNYLNYRPDSNYLTYPKFELIDPNSYTIYSHFADSLNRKNLKYCKKDSLASVKLFGNYGSHMQKVNHQFLKLNPTSDVNCNCRKKTTIPHLYGNVLELTSVQNTVFGASYADSTDYKTTRILTNQQLENSLVGFRNKCTYQTWQQ